MNTKIKFYSLFNLAVRDDADPPAGDPPAGDPPKTFTQEQVNSFLAEERRKSDKKVTELQEKLKTMSVSDADRKTLEQTIETLRGEKESSEQTLTRQLEELKSSSEKSLKKAVDEGLAWKNRYETTMLNNEIINAAIENKAFVPDQVVGLLKGTYKIELREGIGKDNKPNGEFAGWVVGFKDINADKQEVTIDLRIGDAIKRMRDLPQRYGNLFKTEANSGINMTGNVDENNTVPDFSDGAKYRAWRAKNLDKVQR